MFITFRYFGNTMCFSVEQFKNALLKISTTGYFFGPVFVVIVNESGIIILDDKSVIYKNVDDFILIPFSEEFNDISKSISPKHFVQKNSPVIAKIKYIFFIIILLNIFYIGSS